MTDCSENFGITRINDYSVQDKATFAIIGCGRGGTSACSAALHRLGIFSGDGARPPIFEDATLGTACETSNWDQAKSIVDSYNRLYDKWTFKRPSAVGYLDELHCLLRNPFYIFVFRDPQAVATRISAAEGVSYLDSLALVLKNYKLMLRFMKLTQAPSLAISYEKLIQNPLHFIRTFASVANLGELPSETLEEAAATISPSPLSYRSRLRNRLFIGHIDHLDEYSVSGWAAVPDSPGPATLEVYSGDSLIAEGLTDQLRPDVKASGVHSAERCGFRLTHCRTIRDTASVRVYLKGTNHFLAFES